ncbi:ribosome maturation factor RimM [Deinococcus roseus]|uniref:Ribosome maturation factor RimM n=1 Tax=Deinococcus roseus TaxID=392414 RepID=A0ABQ2CVQ5_9DEIO|nr:ribosome maturation factor RimM [Deinococcus roseus]GGJ21759.1 ribosome maturation factor RimM [Deinococcus roseus]
MELTRIATVQDAFGIQGAIKLYTLGDTERYLDLTRLQIEGVGTLKIKKLEVYEVGMVVELIGISSRALAERLKGKQVYAFDEDLPPLEEGVYYYHDLIGLPVRSLEGQDLGKVIAVHDHGHQDTLEVRKGLKKYLVPLQAPYVEVKLGECIILDAPEGLFEV